MIEVKSLPELTELTFDEPTHTYRLNGLIIPSVTTIMQPLSEAKYKSIDEKTLNNAADKGSTVHNSIENYIKFEIEDIPSEHRGYFEAFLEWWNDKKPIVIASEVRVYHKLLGYAGTVDLLAIVDGKLTLIDYKSTYVLSDMLCGVQLEAYAQAFASHGVKIEEKAILHLKKDRKYKFVLYPSGDAKRWRVFGSLKCVYDYIREQ